MKRVLHFNMNNLRQKAYEASHAKNFKMLLWSLLVAVMPFSSSFSNYLNVALVSFDQTPGNQFVTFDLSWQNSWRNPGTTAANWDAAWVFIKWRDCTASSNLQFTHGLVSTTLSNHSFNVLSGATTFEPTQTDGSSGIDASPNNTGVMLRNAASPSSGVVSARVRLKVTNLPATGSLDLRIYALETVYVPQGTYYLGDGNGTNTPSQYCFASTSGNNVAATISSENSQILHEGNNGQIFGDHTVTPAFPKGFAAFYIMKYEITQGQYVDFLNASPSIVKSMHFTSQNSGNRYTITQNADGTIFSASRPYRTCNFLSWGDLGTYLDWAALRPMTELEYEKACRGTGPRTPYENAFAAAFNNPAKTISSSGSEPGTEVITVPGNANINAGNFSFSGGDGGQGPLRGGIYATSGTVTRFETGGSFYGIMDLSGNVDEFYISSISGVSNNPSAGGIAIGDGILSDSLGMFNNQGWPDPFSPSSFIIHRGGSWNTQSSQNSGSQSFLNVSNRYGHPNGFPYNYRLSTTGGRGGRSSGTVVNVVGNQTFNYSGGIQYFTVPNGVTNLTIDAYGGGGANVSTAGRGAEMKASFSVSPNQVLQVLVGGSGSNGSSHGGGGGSFVVLQPISLNNVMIVAGGGGGSGNALSATPASIANGQLNSANGAGGTTYNAGGTNGSGGGNLGNGGGSGGGYTSNGGNNNFTGGTSYTGGGSGSGFGGGGYSSNANMGGGGGGYSGGGGGYSNSTANYSGGGGGSYINNVNFTVTSIITNSQTGTPINTNGQVIFNW